MGGTPSKPKHSKDYTIARRDIDKIYQGVQKNKTNKKFIIEHYMQMFIDIKHFMRQAKLFKKEKKELQKIIGQLQPYFEIPKDFISISAQKSGSYDVQAKSQASNFTPEQYTRIDENTGSRLTDDTKDEKQSDKKRSFFHSMRKGNKSKTHQTQFYGSKEEVASSSQRQNITTSPAKKTDQKVKTKIPTSNSPKNVDRTDLDRNRKSIPQTVRQPNGKSSTNRNEKSNNFTPAGNRNEPPNLKHETEKIQSRLPPKNVVQGRDVPFQSVTYAELSKQPNKKLQQTTNIDNKSKNFSQYSNPVAQQNTVGHNKSQLNSRTPLQKSMNSAPLHLQHERLKNAPITPIHSQQQSQHVSKIKAQFENCNELKMQKPESQIKKRKSEDGPLQTFNIHQYFEDNLDTNNLNILNLREQIEAIYNFAVSLEPKVNSFNKEKDSIDYFVLDEKLMQLLEKLDKIKCQNVEEIIRKNQTVSYINSLHKNLDLRCEERKQQTSNVPGNNINQEPLRYKNVTHVDSYNKAQQERKESEEAPLQILNVHQYFQDSLNTNQLSKMTYEEQIETIYQHATKLQSKIINFDQDKSSMEYFILIEKLDQLMDHLSKIKCRKDRNVMRRKLEVNKYINNLRQRLEDGHSKDQQFENPLNQARDNGKHMQEQVPTQVHKNRATMDTNFSMSVYSEKTPKPHQNLQVKTTNVFFENVVKDNNEVKTQESESQVKKRKADGPLQILNIHQYFEDNLDTNNLKKLNLREQIEAVYNFAVSLEPKVNSFNKEKDSIEYFVLDEKLMQLLEKLDKMKCQNDQEIMRKNQTVNYINSLHKNLDLRCEEKNVYQTPNQGNKTGHGSSKSEKAPLQIQNVHQYFQDGLDVNQLSRLNYTEQIETIYQHATKLQSKIMNFDQDKGSLEYFVLIEKLDQLIDHLSKIKCRNEQNVMRRKLEVNKYINSLRQRLEDGQNEDTLNQTKNNGQHMQNQVPSQIPPKNRAIMNTDFNMTVSSENTPDPHQNHNVKTSKLFFEEVVKDSGQRQIQEFKSQVKERKADGPLQILNIHQYFEDNLDVNNLKKLNLREKIEAIYNFAVSLEPKINTFSEEKDSIEYFVLDEKLMQLLEKLDKMKCQNDQEIMKKNQTVNYINSLHKKLDLRCEEKNKEVYQTPNQDNKTDQDSLKSEKASLQIHNAHQYFQDGLDVNQLSRLNYKEQIETIYQHAIKLQSKIINFDQDKSSMEYFVLIKKLDQLIDHLSKINCRNEQNVIRRKLEVNKYINDLRQRLENGQNKDTFDQTKNNEQHMHKPGPLQVPKNRAIMDTDFNMTVYSEKTPDPHQNHNVKASKLFFEEVVKNSGETQIQESKSQVTERKADGPLQILNIHQYFEDNLDVNNLKKLNLREQIEAIYNFAVSLESKVNSFSEEKDSIEYFVLDEKLMQLLEKLDKMKCQNDQEIMRKNQTVNYINSLHKNLDLRCEEKNEEVHQTPNQGNKTDQDSSKPEKTPLQIQNVHQYFQDDLDVNQLGRLNYKEQIEAIYQHATKLQSKINNFDHHRSSVEYFGLIEKLDQLIDHLSKIKCRNERNAMRRKLEVNKYINSLRQRLEDGYNKNTSDQTKSNGQNRQEQVPSQAQKNRAIMDTNFSMSVSSERTSQLHQNQHVKTSKLFFEEVVKDTNEVQIQESESQVKKRKADGPLQILNIHQYFEDNLDTNNLKKLNLREQIEAVYNFAVSLEPKVNSFNEEKDSIEYFVLDEKLMQLLEKLDKMKCENDQEIMRKNQTVNYINSLHKKLDLRCEEKNEDIQKKQNVDNKTPEPTENKRMKRKDNLTRKGNKLEQDLATKINLDQQNYHQNQLVKTGHSLFEENAKTDNELKVQETEYQVKKRKAEDSPLQIFDMHQYFQDSLDTNNLKKLSLREQIKAIYNFAVSLESKVNSFNEEKDSIEYFVLDEKLMQLLEKLDKMKCQDDQEIMRKNQTVNYINSLHKILDLRSEEKNKDFQQTRNEGKKMRQDPSKSEKAPFEVQNVQQHFQSNLNQDQLSELSFEKQIETINQHAKKLENEINNFDQDKMSGKYFVLVDKLKQLLDHLSKVKCRKEQNVIQKLEVNKYINKLLQILEDRLKEKTKSQGSPDHNKRAKTKKSSVDDSVKNEVEMKNPNQTKASQDTQENTEDKPLQIFNVHQFFQDNLDMKSLKKLSLRDQIEAIHKHAVYLKPKVDSFNEEKDSIEFFVLDEKLMQLVEALDKIKPQNDEDTTKKKLQAIKYINELQDTLDSRC